MQSDNTVVIVKEVPFTKFTPPLPDELEFQGPNYNACRDYLHAKIENYKTLCDNWSRCALSFIEESRESLQKIRELEKQVSDLNFEILERDIKELADCLSTNNEGESDLTRGRRNRKIISGVRNGNSFRNVAAEVGVHHRTAQRVAAANDVWSARSWFARAEDFTKKGLKVFIAQNPDREYVNGIAPFYGFEKVA